MDLDCRSTYWYLKAGGMYEGQSSCQKVKNIYRDRRCSSSIDNVNNTAAIQQQYKTKFTINSGIVTDPFLDTLNEYELWHSAD